MRVISGMWRGRRLAAPAGRAIRPTTDRTKEALFNILGPAVVGSTVLDLCCGAGGLGIEALSRGARRAFFVDSGAGGVAAVRSNLAACGAPGGSFEVIRAEAASWLSAWTGAGGDSWILLCDPPYQSGTARAIIDLVTAGGLPPNLLTAVVEFGAHTPDLELPDSAWSTRRYGASRLAIHRPGAAPERKD